ncbi:MAG: endolytic transglycosylase MltG [Muribaculaceae bacterium]|nr:endolytic transglycosylase MltG [Muribaculaceae bacterium]
MTPRKNVKKKTEVPGRKIYILSGLAIALIALMIWGFPYVMAQTPREALIRIPATANQKTLTDSLSKYYGDKFASKVIGISRFPKDSVGLRHGSYLIPEGSNPLSVSRRLTHGAQTPVTVTINGFRSLDNLIQRISAKLDFPADSLRAVLADSTVMAEYGLRPEQALALFADDSYQLYWTASPREVVKKIGSNYLSIWNKERKDKAAALGLTPAEVMIICSITDEETNAKAEKGTIGRLYINRLRKGMKLQSDPTVRFALNDFTIRRVKGEHLKADSPYNTYRYAGLPPGPIRTTGKATIDSVLNSDPNDYIFMCAKEDFSGTHNFAVTFEEHQENARRYQKALDERGIK